MGKKFSFSFSDGMECLVWLSQSYPDIFKQWVCVRQTQPAPDMMDIKIGTWEEKE